jgi:hypothetical protein
MSVAGNPTAHEFALSPIALGYLFSSFLWVYVLMMLPGGRLIDFLRKLASPVARRYAQPAAEPVGQVGRPGR